MKKTQLFLLNLALLCILSVNVYATNGYWSHGYGAKSKSIAGACVAVALDAMCAVTNPAMLAIVGNRLDYGLALFLPWRGFTANDDASPIGPPMGPASIPPGRYESSNDWFLIPHISYNRMVDDNSSIGIFMASNGGMNTEYGKPIFGNFSNPTMPETQITSKTGIDLAQIFLGVTYSRKITEQHSFGVTPIIAIQALEVKGLQPFIPFSASPQKVTNQGQDFSYGGGIRVGWLSKITDQLSLGASYQSRISMGEFDEYQGLLAEQGGFDIPATYDLGFAYQMTPEWLLAFDYQRIEYGSVNALSNASDLAFFPGQTLLGTDDGLGFGWENMNIYKLGLQWKYSPDMTFQFGYSYANNPFPNTQALFNTLAPAVVRQHYTFGFTTPLSENVEFTMAFMYAPKEEVHGSNINTGPQTGFVEMEQLEIEMSWGIRF
jgi:long-chain fatty acid transport protein